MLHHEEKGGRDAEERGASEAMPRCKELGAEAHDAGDGAEEHAGEAREGRGARRQKREAEERDEQQAR